MDGSYRCHGSTSPGIGLGIRSGDPVIEYKLEGYEMFEEMVKNIQEDTLRVYSV